MKAFACFSFLIFFAHADANASATAVRASTVEEVSVRLRSLKGAVTIAGQDVVILNGDTSVFRAQGFRRFVFKFVNGVWTFTDADSDRALAQIPNRKIDIEGSGLRVDLRPAPAHIQLNGKSTRLDLVGVMPLETYLEGVVAGEIPRDWPLEALKAQAVAARSFTLAKIRERQAASPEWLFEANVSDQVFDHERVHSRATDAVHATRGETLRDGIGHEVVAANYHSDCGGTTDEPGVIWGGRETANGTSKDVGCSMRPRWRYVTETQELTKRLENRGDLKPGFRLAALAISKRSQGGRALVITATAKSGEIQSFSGERLRAALGYGELKSTLFEIKTSGVSGAPGQIEIVGRGFGHGTGLCQWGARQLALNGRDYREILRHYYPNLELGLDAKINSPVSAEPRLRGVTLGANASP